MGHSPPSEVSHVPPPDVPASDASPSTGSPDAVRTPGPGETWGGREFPITLPDGDPLLTSTHLIESPAREAMRESWIEAPLKDVHPAESGKKILYAMGGGGASGKGFVAKTLEALGVVPERNVVHLDPDGIKTTIPEYQQIVDAGDSRAAAVVHEESSMIAKAVLNRAFERGLDVVYDVTLGDPKKAIALFERAKALGYEVHLHGVTVDPSVAVVRNGDRAAVTGRYVPVPMQLSAHQGFSRGFEAYADLVDLAFLHDTNGPGDFKTIAVKARGGDLTIVDAQRYADFQHKADLDPHAEGPAQLYPSRPQIRPPDVPLDRAHYIDHAMENLQRTSRTAQGVVDTSASADKTADMAAGLSGEHAARFAAENFRRVIEDLHAHKDVTFESPHELRTFVEEVARGINDGIVRDGVLYRQHDSDKFPYTKVEDLPRAAEEFFGEFHDRLTDPHTDPVETAAWVEYRMNLTDHLWADGTGKTSKAVSAWVLMREGYDLPVYPSDRRAQFEFAPRHPRSLGDAVDAAQFRDWHDHYRTLFTPPDAAGIAPGHVEPHLAIGSEDLTQRSTPEMFPDTSYAINLHRLQSDHPDISEVIAALEDHGHALNLVEDLSDPQRRATTARHLADLAEGAKLGSMPLERFLQRYPSRGLLFSRIAVEVNYTNEGLSRKQAFIDAAKAADLARALGTHERDVWDTRVREYVTKLLTVEEHVELELQGLLDGIDDAVLHSRTKAAADLVDKVVRMTSGAQGRAARPDYRIGDVIDAVGARITVPDTEALERVYQRVIDEFGVGDHGRILELENMYAAPKPHAPAYRLLAMIVRVDLGGESFSYELQLTTHRASIAADLNHNTVYKPIEPVSHEQAKLIQQMMNEAAAADQAEFVSRHFEAGRDLGPLYENFRPGIFDLQGKGKFTENERSAIEWLYRHRDSQVSIHNRATIEDNDRRLKNPDVILRVDPSDPGQRIEIKTVTKLNPNVQKIRNVLSDAEEQVGPFGGGGAVIDGRRADLTRSISEESYRRELSSATARGSSLPELVIFLLGDGSHLMFGGFNVR